MPHADRPSERPRRTIDDEELDSGDDEGRYDRAGDRMDYDEGEEGGYRETLNVMDLNLGRAPEPESSNGEVCLNGKPWDNQTDIVGPRCIL